MRLVDKKTCGFNVSIYILYRIKSSTFTKYCTDLFWNITIYEAFRHLDPYTKKHKIQWDNTFHILGFRLWLSLIMHMIVSFKILDLQCTLLSLHPFLYKQRFFSTQPQFCLIFLWIEFQILFRYCLMHMAIVIFRHILYLVC